MALLVLYAVVAIIVALAVFRLLFLIFGYNGAYYVSGGLIIAAAAALAGYHITTQDSLINGGPAGISVAFLSALGVPALIGLALMIVPIRRNQKRQWRVEKRKAALARPEPPSTTGPEPVYGFDKEP